MKKVRFTLLLAKRFKQISTKIVKKAVQIEEAIIAQKSMTYITYVLIAWLMKLMPDWIYTRVM